MVVVGGIKQRYIDPLDPVKKKDRLPFPARHTPT